MTTVIECTVEVIESTELLDAATFARLCRLDPGFLAELVDAGVLEPEGDSFANWRFPAAMLPRGRIAARLRHDLGLDAPALALVLDLLEERNRLERQIALLRAVLDANGP